MKTGLIITSFAACLGLIAGLAIIAAKPAATSAATVEVEVSTLEEISADFGFECIKTIKVYLNADESRDIDLTKFMELNVQELRDFASFVTMINFLDQWNSKYPYEYYQAAYDKLVSDKVKVEK